MVALAGALLAVVTWLLLRRVLAAGPGEAAITGPAWAGCPRRGRWALALAVTIATQVPLLRAISPILLSDACGHAAIAAYLARTGAPHGWIDLFNGGFPLGPHYPSVGWILAAILIRAGVPAAYAISGLAVLATAAVPVLALLAGRALGARPLAALAGALVIGCASPLSAFVGGWAGYLEQGLVSQALVMPLVVGWLWALASARSTVLPPVLAALSLATHPQVATSAFLVGGTTALLVGDARVRGALARSAIAAFAVAAAVFAPGIPTLRVPFGWPPMVEWKRIGFPAVVVIGKLGDGDILDAGAVPVITAGWGAALVVALVLRHRPACRAALVATVAGIAAATSGGMLDALGPLGAAVLSLFQPLRAMAVLPCVAAAVVLVAVEELGPAVRSRLPARLHSARALPAVAWAAVLIFMAPAIRGRIVYGAEVRETLGSWAGSDWCTGDKPAGYSTALVTEWVRRIPRGRFTIAKDQPLQNCPASHGVELASPVPMGRPIGAGAHVGVNHIAFRQLRLEAPGSALRAESLGIRAVLHTRERRPPPGEAWQVVAEEGDMMLSERRGGTDFVGVGCVAREAAGTNAALHAALIEDLEDTASQLQDPRTLLRLRWTDGPLHVSPVPRDGCDPEGAVVRETPREPGAYEADVALAHPADVVVRASAFPTWSVIVDGARVPTFVVAPGFLAARLGPGQHHLVATVAPLPGYAAGIGVAALVVAACALVRLQRPGQPQRAPSDVSTESG